MVRCSGFWYVMQTTLCPFSHRIENAVAVSVFRIHNVLLISSSSWSSSIYPHGVWSGLAMFVSSAAALAAVGYGVASCRMFVVTFTSNQGCFDDFFDIYGNGGNVLNDDTVACKTAIGLYQWLRPNSGGSEWDDGSCVGYSQSMRDKLSDPLFETARVCGIVAVMLAIMIVIWVFFLSCIEMNKCQVWLLRICAFLGTIASGLSFLINLSQVCTSLFESQSCTIDSGGMAVAAGSILYFATLVLSIFCVKPLSLEQQQQRNAQLTPTTMNGSFDGSDVSNDKLSKELAAAKSRRSNQRSLWRKAYSERDTTTSSSSRSAPSSSRSAPARGFFGGRNQRQQRQTASGRRRPQSAPAMTGLAQPQRSGSFDNNSISSQPSWATPRPPRPKERVTIDDISNGNEMEVYISHHRRRPSLESQLSEV